MIQENKEETSKEATVNGRPLENINIVCSKHGVINNGAFYIRYTSFKKDETDATKTIAVDNNNIFCISCLNEMYLGFQKEGKVGKISLNVQYKDEDGKVSEQNNVALEDADIAPATIENAAGNTQVEK